MLYQCDCSISISDDDQADVYCSRDVRARKQHRCVECQCIIQPGETYERTAMLYDGQWDTYRTCLGCRRLREAFCSHGWLFGGVAEQIEECVGFDYRTPPEELEDDDEEEPEP